MFVVKRNKNNPLISPKKDGGFESWATFNANPIKIGSKTVLVYRAQNEPEHFDGGSFSLSVIGKAESSDGIKFKNREAFITPEHSWERFGCEDPRVTKIDGKYYIFYTALSAYPLNIPGGIKVGLAISRDMEKISEKHLVTPFNAKAMTLFPEKIDGKYCALLTVNPDVLPTHIAMAEFKRIEDIWDEKYWQKWYKNLDKNIFIRGDEADRIEIGSSPIKTKKGWLLLTCRIQNHSAPNRVFTIEAILMDFKDPRKIIGKTRGAILVPEEKYEKEGIMPNIIFPSGGLVEKDKLIIYYGGTDTVICRACVDLEPLLEAMELPHKETGFMRVPEGPVLSPQKEKSWEARAVFNPAAIDVDGTVSILFRAMSQDNTSVIGYAESKDGKKLTYVSDEPVYIPRESFERKGVPNGNSGCEDPRLTRIGNTIYMYYTAFNGITPPSVAMASISVSDFKNKKWNWKKPVLVTKDGVDDKDGCLHPEKVNGQYFLFHRTNNTIVGDFGKTPEFKERGDFKNIPIIYPREGMWDSVKVGISVPPIKTKKGWLLLYHGVSHRSRYRVGAALLDLKDPTKVISRSTDPLFEPREAYEIEGEVGYVVFPCGAVVKDDKIIMYYGGADKVVDVAEVSLQKLLDILTK